jgi:YesN/AraC family two-component response regulator
VEAGQRFDLLLTDVVMPGMGGKELAQRVRLAIPGIKVLFISGYTDNAFANSASLQPHMAFLQKPFTSATLMRAVRGILDR